MADLRPVVGEAAAEARHKRFSQPVNLGLQQKVERGDGGNAGGGCQIKPLQRNQRIDGTDQTATHTQTGIHSHGQTATHTSPTRAQTGIHSRDRQGALRTCSRMEHSEEKTR